MNTTSNVEMETRMSLKNCTLRALRSAGPAVLIVVLLGGCALVPDDVSLAYKSLIYAPPVPGAQRISVAVAITDERPSNRDRVGVKKNGYGMEMAAIRSTIPIEVLVGRAIEQELQKQGFMLATGGPVIRVAIDQFRNDFKMGFFSGNAVGEVTLSAVVVGPDGRPAYAHSVTGESNIDGVMIAGGDNAKLALDEALSSAVARLFADPALDAALLETRAPESQSNS